MANTKSLIEPLRMLRLALILVALCYVIHFLFLGFLVGPHDFDIFSAYYELAWRFWTTQSGLPHFNPFLCGGRTLGADPQIPIFNPLILLVPVLGPSLLIRWEMLFQLALGTYGLIQLFRLWKIPQASILWGVFLYVSGGGMIARFLVGHVTVGFFFLFPLFLYLSYKMTISDRRMGLLLGYCLLFVYCGLYKPNFLIFGVPLLGIEVLCRSLVQRNFRPVLWFGVGLVFCVFCNAIIYLPSWRYFSEFPRTRDAGPLFIPPYTLAANIFIPLKAIPKAFYGPVFRPRHEYNIFIGPVAFWYAVIGLGMLFPALINRFYRREKQPLTSLSQDSPANRPERWSLLVLLIGSCLLGLGSLDEGFSWWLPYTWLRPFWPGFEYIRTPMRFWYGAYLALIIFSVLGFTLPRKWISRLGFLLLGIVPLLVAAIINLSKTTIQAEITQWSTESAYPKDIVVRQNHPEKILSFIQQGMSTLQCSGNIENFPSKTLHEGSLLEVFPGDTPVRARWLGWNRIAVQSESTTQFSLNLSHFPYWKYQGGQVISSLNEPLTVKTDKLSGELVFTQPWVSEGLWISLISWGCLLVWFVGFVAVRRLRGPRPS